MEQDQPGQWRLPRWCDLILLVVLLISVIVLTAGWGAGYDSVRRVRAGYAAMVPTTALLFLLFSASLLLFLRRGQGKALLAAVGAIGIAMAVLNLSLILTGLSNGIDALVWQGDPVFHQDRMAVATALCFLLLGVVFLTLPMKTANQPLFVICATAGWSLSAIVFIGYLFGAEELYAVSLFTAMALHTSLCFLALFTVALFARPDRGWVRILMGRGEGSRGARRLMPFVILVPLSLCLAVLFGMRQGWYGADFRLSLLAILNIALLATTVLYNATLENRTNRRLRGTLKRLEKASADKDLLLGEVYHRVKNNLQQIVALIWLEARQMPADSREPMKALSGRVRALAQVHELLVTRPDLSTVRLEEFIHNLCDGLLSANLPRASTVQCHVDVQDREVGVDFAIKLGLLINELLTNAPWQAAGEERARQFGVHCTSTSEGGLILMVEADSALLSGDNEATPGQRMVEAFVRSVGGEARTEPGEGRTASIHIPASEVC